MTGALAFGRERVTGSDVSAAELAATDSAEMNAGDVFVIETPGGGFGRPD